MSTTTPPDLRMDAYYYGFEPTGVREIDLILSAVACAGKAFHETADWRNDARPYDGHTGETPEQWIQNAASKAAEALCAAHNAAPAAAPVAEVLWYDPVLYPEQPKTAHKIIDASIAWIESAPIGTKLYAAPAAAQPNSDAQDTARYRWLKANCQDTCEESFSGGFTLPTSHALTFVWERLEWVNGKRVVKAELDEAIDAAMGAAAPAGEQQPQGGM